MRADIVLTAAIAALLTPSLAAYTCDRIHEYDAVLKCCPQDNLDECTNPPRVPKNLDDFQVLCYEESRSKEANCCVMSPRDDGKPLVCALATWKPRAV